MVSLLEKTNSWKPFVEEICGAVLAKDFRKKTIRTILHFVDPELSFWPGSLWYVIKGSVLGSGFVSGRVSLYFYVFQQFMVRNNHRFDHAPVVVFRALNKLIASLFPKEFAEKLLLDEARARQRLSDEKRLLQEGAQAQQSLQRFLQKSVEGEGKEPVFIETKEQELQYQPSLFSVSSPFGKEEQDRMRDLCERSGFLQDLRLCRECISLLEERVNRFQDVGREMVEFFTQPIYVQFHRIFQDVQKFVALPDCSEFFVVREKIPFQQLVEDRFQEREKWLQECKDRMTLLVQKMEAIEQKRNQLQAFFLPFSQKKDVKVAVDALLAQLKLFTFPHQLLENATIEEIDEAIRKKAKEWKILEARVPKQFHNLLMQLREHELTSDLLHMIMIIGRWELFSDTIPFPDLQETVIPIRTHLVQLMDQLDTTFFIGEKSLEEYVRESIDLIYDPDIRLVRGEMATRALRLKELRETVGGRLKEVDLLVSLGVFAKVQMPKLVQARNVLFSFYQKVQDPYPLFRETYNAESVQRVFRYLWKDFEQFRVPEIQKNEIHISDLLVREILSTLDLLGRLSAPRRVLYQQFIDRIAEKDESERLVLLREWLSEREGWVEPWIILLASFSYHDQERLIAKLLQLETLIIDRISLARSLQFVKTFEPERIDSILEAFDSLSFLPSSSQDLSTFSDHLQHMERVVQLVEEEIIIEMGLLSKKVCMEKGEGARQFLEHVHLHFSEFQHKIESQLLGIANQQDFVISKLSRFAAEQLKDLKISRQTLFSVLPQLAVALIYRRIFSALSIYQCRSLLLPLALEYVGVLAYEFQIDQQKIDALGWIVRKVWKGWIASFEKEKQTQQKKECKQLIENIMITPEIQGSTLYDLLQCIVEVIDEPRGSWPKLVYVIGDMSYFLS